MQQENLIDQLLYFYYAYDRFQEPYLGEDDARRYYEVALAKNRIHTCYGGVGHLLGYGESWKITFEQLGRLICRQRWDIAAEDIENGYIAYLANVTVLPQHRGRDVLRYLRNEFFMSNQDCKFFIGHARRKKHQPIKVFTKQEAFDQWAFKGVVQHGRVEATN